MGCGSTEGNKYTERTTNFIKRNVEDDVHYSPDPVPDTLTRSHNFRLLPTYSKSKSFLT